MSSRTVIENIADASAPVLGALDDRENVSAATQCFLRAIHFKEERASLSSRPADLPTAQQTPLRRLPSRIGIKCKRNISFVDAREISAVEAQANYVLVRHKTANAMVRESISAMAEKLKPFGLVRIHRSYLVNVAFVEEIKALASGEYSLRIRGGHRYTVSRKYKNNLRFLADVWCGVNTGLFV